MQFSGLDDRMGPQAATHKGVHEKHSPRETYCISFWHSRPSQGQGVSLLLKVGWENGFGQQKVWNSVLTFTSEMDPG